ncbi:type VII secretion-associated serine protease mycosin [Microbispora sp. GKU 823]|uniref:type VII secretion-associated serine protease mycosin n=1 Tax=Microbispora sp. GKU 823 TaxID=1652100 RepID=UPI0009A2B4A7|nr:type VII secretion-associated serine protease mycosin [Microbispora sp. GKU 823]OPG11305.1 type VII secretion-associated serine protease mycosin [Microbispora sp. GKU 823]
MRGPGLLATVLALLLMAPPAPPAQARAAPVRCAPRKGSMQVAEPWAQRRLDPKRVWPLTTGEGVTVAIIDSGVDLTHPQLRVAKEVDYTGTGHRDCVGHGTAVAGIIAAQYVKGVPFVGVAPGVRLISLKQTNEENGDPDTLARAIVDAADAGADVINVSIDAHDDPKLRQAVAYALGKDAVIVAAAGNRTAEDGTPEASYPAAYPGVLAVGSATPDGRRADFSNTATPVGVLGPGQAITSTWPGRAYMSGLEGTSFAAPYVAGVAALVRARHPELSQERVRWRITATADGGVGTGTGAGMVNPLLAVTAILPLEAVDAPVIAPPAPAPLPQNAVSRAAPVDQEAIDLALTIAAAALCAVGLIVAVRVFAPMGRRRRWRPGREG